MSADASPWSRLALWVGHILWLLAPVLVLVFPVLVFTESGTWQRWLAAGLVVVLAWRLRKFFLRRWQRLRLHRRISHYWASSGLWGDSWPQARVTPGTAPGSWRIRVATPPHATDQQVRDLDDDLAAYLGAYLVQSESPTISARAGAVEFALALRPGVLTQDHIDDLPLGSLTSEKWTIPVGIDGLGEVVSITPWTRAAGAERLLIFGTSGSGKSSASVRLVRAAQAHGLDTYVYDPHSGSMRGLHADCTTAATTPTEALDMLREVKQVVHERTKRLAMGETLRPGIAVVEEFQNLLQSEELVTYEGKKKVDGRREIEEIIGYLSREIRKSGPVLALTQQSPTANAGGGTEIRDQMSIFCAFGTPTSRAGLVLDETGADMCARLLSAPPGACVLADMSRDSQHAGAAVPIRMPAAGAPPIPTPTLSEQVNEVFDDINSDTDEFPPINFAPPTNNKEK